MIKVFFLTPTILYFFGLDEYCQIQDDINKCFGSNISNTIPDILVGSINPQQSISYTFYIHKKHHTTKLLEEDDRAHVLVKSIYEYTEHIISPVAGSPTKQSKFVFEKHDEISLVFKDPFQVSVYTLPQNVDVFRTDEVGLLKGDEVEGMMRVEEHVVVLGLKCCGPEDVLVKSTGLVVDDSRFKVFYFLFMGVYFFLKRMMFRFNWFRLYLLLIWEVVVKIKKNIFYFVLELKANHTHNMIFRVRFHKRLQSDKKSIQLGSLKLNWRR